MAEAAEATVAAVHRVRLLGWQQEKNDVIYYEMECEGPRGCSWKLVHRFSDFAALREAGRHRGCIAGPAGTEVLVSHGRASDRLPVFPSKWKPIRASLGARGPFLNRRQQELETWLQAVLAGTRSALAQSEAGAVSSLWRMNRLLISFLEVPPDLATPPPSSQVIQATMMNGRFSDDESDGADNEEASDDEEAEDMFWEKIEPEQEGGASSGPRTSCKEQDEQSPGEGAR
uniref:PX domain-containing protein n=1 Tax=Rhizochromulina marina TaxID=1034831 RepID=A0A7S2SVW6_9STRA|mmetsp:Transcript_9808/g.27778  ORF Transcript_9808/g.27778 Transcript_9808/m.27778 type:complete len:230 (+) Transcript_9808:57-746(+)